MKKSDNYRKTKIQNCDNCRYYQYLYGHDFCTRRMKVDTKSKFEEIKDKSQYRPMLPIKRKILNWLRVLSYTHGVDILWVCDKWETYGD